jgi:hypothetical protein
MTLDRLRGHPDAAPDAPAREGTLHLDGWAGRTRHTVDVIGETPKRYRIRAREGLQLPGRWLAAGAVALVPKYAVTITAALAAERAAP